MHHTATAAMSCMQSNQVGALANDGISMTSDAALSSSSLRLGILDNPMLHRNERGT